MTAAGLRLDKWLWFARFAKTRADAQKLIDRGQVVLNGKPVGKIASTVRAGDVLVLTLGASRHTVTVVALGTRRGPAPEAQALYSRASAPEKLGWEEAALPLHRRG